MSGDRNSFGTVLLFGASGGIGAALARALEHTTLTAVSRSAGDFDLADEPSLASLAGRVAGPFDLILDATGALAVGEAGPEKTIAAIDPAAMAAQFAVNAIGPALILKHFHRHLRRDGRAVFATLSARVGSIGDNRLGGWISYRAAKAALNQIVRTAAIEIARKRPEAVCVALHPGTVSTGLSADYVGRHPAVTPDRAAANLLAVLAALGPAQSGGFFAWDGRPIPW